MKTVLAMFLAVLCLTTAAWAENETNVSSGKTLKGFPLAAHGYDVVAYFKAHRPMKGLADFSEVYEGATYRFSSKENMETFRNDPAKHAPQFGGYCAYGVALGDKFDGDPDYWTIHKEKLYFNLNGEIQQLFNQDVTGHIAKAQENWKKIANKRPDEL